MKIGSILLGFILGASLAYFIYDGERIRTSIAVSEMQGKVSVLNEVCPSFIDKIGILKKK